MDVQVQYGKINRWSIYTTSIYNTYLYYTDGIEIWRKGVRNGLYVIDHALTSIGFAGYENSDWENIWSIS
jgi:hypothetical protein